jgi:hypothetical protein
MTEILSLFLAKVKIVSNRSKFRELAFPSILIYWYFRSQFLDMPERAVASVFETKGQNGLSAIKNLPYRLIFKKQKSQ